MKGEHMFIHEAAQEATAKDGYIRRRSWPRGISVRPTDTIDNCVLHGTYNAPRRGWQPKACDLMATDWETLLNLPRNKPQTTLITGKGQTYFVNRLMGAT